MKMNGMYEQKKWTVLSNNAVSMPRINALLRRVNEKGAGDCACVHMRAQWKLGQEEEEREEMIIMETTA